MLRQVCYAVVGVFICVALSFAQWQNPEPLSVLNSDADEVRPTLTHDGNTIYFSSNRDGTMDIWTAKKVGGDWQSLTKLPDTINDKDYNDWLPYISWGGDTLYFVSDRRGAGNYDIYKSAKIDGGWISTDWEDPKRLPYPILTNQHE